MLTSSQFLNRCVDPCCSRALAHNSGNNSGSSAGLSDDVQGSRRTCAMSSLVAEFRDQKMMKNAKKSCRGRAAAPRHRKSTTWVHLRDVKFTEKCWNSESWAINQSISNGPETLRFFELVISIFNTWHFSSSAFGESCPKHPFRAPAMPRHRQPQSWPMSQSEKTQIPSCIEVSCHDLYLSGHP